MGLDHIAAGNGVAIAITGMLVVMAGLVLISAFIALLPRLFDGLSTLRDRRVAQAARKQAGGRRAALAGAGETASSELDPDLLAAIGFVIQAEWEREAMQDRQRITIRDDGEQQVWTALGKMRTLSTRL